jgi:hypothetical protein
MHTEACKKCPFRRNSAPGWLGEDTPENFVSNALADFSDHPLPCHAAIDYEDPDWLENQYPHAPLCAGALIFCKNNMKLPRDAERSELVRSVKVDSDVFSTPNEFLDHHRR